MFIKGSGISGLTSTNIWNASTLFDKDNGNNAASTILSKGWIANSPIFKNLRKHFIYLLGMKKRDGSGNTKLQRLVWNVLIPITVLIYTWFKLLVKRKWYYLGVCTAILIRIPVVVLTEPSSWIMYVLSFYFLGYVCLVYGVMMLLGKRRGE
jgi:hypothetical protein